MHVLLLTESNPEHFEKFEKEMRAIEFEDGSHPIPREIRMYEAIIQENNLDEFLQKLGDRIYNPEGRVPSGWIIKLAKRMGVPIKDISEKVNKYRGRSGQRRRRTDQPSVKVFPMGAIEDKKREDGLDIL